MGLSTTLMGHSTTIMAHHHTWSRDSVLLQREFIDSQRRGCERERERVKMASSSSSSSRGEMEKMGIEQLKAVKEQVDLEVNLLQDSLNNIRTATVRLDNASTALNDLSLRPQGKKMLVPLTASLYVPGTLDDADKVLVDIGTGYFIEKTMDEGKDYCQRKINLLKSNFEQLFEVAAKKKSVADEAGMVLQAKLRQLQAPSS